MIIIGIIIPLLNEIIMHRSYQFQLAKHIMTFVRGNLEELFHFRATIYTIVKSEEFSMFQNFHMKIFQFSKNFPPQKGSYCLKAFHLRTNYLDFTAKPSLRQP